MSAEKDWLAEQVPDALWLAWMVNMNLSHPRLEEAYGAQVIQIRYRETWGHELLVALGGELVQSSHSATGWQFYQRHYADYRQAVLSGQLRLSAQADAAGYSQVSTFLNDRHFKVGAQASGWGSRLRRWFGKKNQI